MTLLVPLLALSLGSAGQSPNASGSATEPLPFAARRQAAVKLIEESRREVSVAYRTLSGDEEWMHEADRVVHAASTMKVAVMVELFRQESLKQLRLSDELEIRNEFKSVVDGSPFAMDFGEDSDDTVYKNIGGRMPLEALNFQMITVSSNFATNLLINRLGVLNIRATMEKLGAYGLQVRRGVEDQKAFDRGIVNETTARGLFVVMDALARGSAVSKSASERMIEVLSNQKFRDGLPRGVPPGTKVAHKTGTITRVHHDAGIIYGRNPCVLVILTRGFEKEADSDALIASITRALLP